MNRLRTWLFSPLTSLRSASYSLQTRHCLHLLLTDVRIWIDRRPRLLHTRRAAIDRYRLPAWPTAANPPHAAAAAQDGTDRQRRTPSRYIDLAAYYASSVSLHGLGLEPLLLFKAVNTDASFCGCLFNTKSTKWKIVMPLQIHIP